MCKLFPIAASIGQAALIMVLGTALAPAADLGSQTVKLWEYVDFTVANPSWSGNAFDLVATAQCTHADGTTKTLRLFYDGGTTWRIRFMGSKRGSWSFVTSSSDSDLHGHTGTVQVTNQTNGKIKGLLKPHAQNVKKWARQIDDQGNDEALVPNMLMIKNVGLWYQDPDAEVDRLLALFGDGWNGIHFPAAGAWWDKTAEGGGYTPAENADPDIESFRAMERLMTRFHHAGKVLHFWFQGEGKYRMDWPAMQRVMPYIAARLGPIPNWSMGLGFDGAQFSNGTFGDWRDACNDNTPYDHIFGQRRQTMSDDVDYASWEDAKWYTVNYQTFIDHYHTITNKPLASEDRFRIRDYGAHKNVTESLTRKTLYYTTFAGGFKAIWGSLMDPEKVPLSGYYNTVDHTRDASQKYFNDHWYTTYETAIHGKRRFLHDMEPVAQVGNEMVLADADGDHLLHYEEDVSKVTLRLGGMNGVKRVIAINTTMEYGEIFMGTFAPGVHSIDLPAFSDWLLAVGTFPLDSSDLQPPQLADVIVTPGLEDVYVVFNEAISGATLSQFSLSGATITKVVHTTDPRRARLEVTGLKLGEAISVSATNIQDIAGNTAGTLSGSTVVGAPLSVMDFSDGDFNGWKAIDPLPTDPDAHPEQGTWLALADGSIRDATVRGHESYLILSDFDAQRWHGYAINCDVVGRLNAIRPAYMEVIIGFESVDDYHAISYEEGHETPTGTLSVIRVSGGATTTLASATSPTIARDASKPMRIEMHKGSIRVVYDGAEMFGGPVSAPGLTTGSPAFRAVKLNRMQYVSNVRLQLLDTSGGGGGGGTPPTITAISASPAIVTATTTQLQVTASEPDGDTISTTWAVAGKPVGADPQIGNGEGTTVVFDQAGEYTFTVTVTDKDGSDSDSVTVLVEQAAAALEVVP